MMPFPPPVRDSHYMRTRTPYVAQGPRQLTVPGGALVFLFGEDDRDGMATVIFDGQVMMLNPYPFDLNAAAHW